jgi:hypothetical protein
VASYVLQPCIIRADRFIPNRKEGPVSFDWASLCRTLAPSGQPAALKVLSVLQMGHFVGLVQRPGRDTLTNFVFRNAQGPPGAFQWLLKKDPSFPERVEVVYQVERADRGALIQEAP